MIIIKKYNFLILIISLLFNSPKVVHVYVTLADTNQGIISSNPDLEDGNNPNTNQYWGALYGVEQFLRRSPQWNLIETTNSDSSDIIKRIILKHNNNNIYIVADAYRGDINATQATHDVFESLSGIKEESIEVNEEILSLHSNADLIVYMGHNFNYRPPFNYRRHDKVKRDVILLSCYNISMCDYLNDNVNTILLTKQFMAPEAYILENVLEGWIAGEIGDDIKLRAAKAYSKYQRCSLNAALGVFTTQCN